MVEAIVEMVLKKLNSLVQREFGLIWGARTEIKKLSSNLSAIKALLEDAEVQQITSKAVDYWLRKLKNVAYDADDILDEWAIEFPSPPEYHELSNKNSINQVRDSSMSYFHFKQVVFCYKIAKKIKEIREKFDEIAKEKSQFNFKEASREGVVSSSDPLPTHNRETSFVIKESQVYGRDVDKEIIVNKLLKNDNDAKYVFVLPIIGIGGLGKTTLAQFIYNDERVVSCFDYRIWVCVSDDFDVKKLSKVIIESISKSCCGLDKLDTIQKCLREVLSKKKYLLVLDDVWNEEQDKWNLMKNSLGSGAKGSSIIITTRLQTVAEITSSTDIYQLKPLSDNDCWKLFGHYAFGSGNKDKFSLVAIGKESMKKCRGTPLVAKALGGLLRFKSEVRQWELVRDNEIWELEGGEENTILPSLRLSYINLSPILRQCFVFCSLFPKDYILQKEMLIHVWMAHGLLQSDGRREPEDVGEDIFSELVWRSFFQNTERERYGNIIACKVHGLMHDLASSLMQNDFSNVNLVKGNPLGPSLQPHLRTLFFHATQGDFSAIHHVKRLRMLKATTDTSIQTPPPSVGNLKHLRCLYLRHCGIESLPDKFFCGLRKLQILDLSENCISHIPTSIHNLGHLRHLNLFRNNLRSLPESICSLKNLQTLNLISNYICDLPENTSNLCNLKHLELTPSYIGCYIDIEIPPPLNCMPIGIGRLKCLQTLSVFMASAKRGSDGGLKELEGLNLLRGFLEVNGLQRVTDPSMLGKLMTNKNNLSELVLIWHAGRYTADATGDVQSSSKQVLESLEPSPNIKILTIQGYQGSKFPTWMQMGSFPCIVEISLFGMQNLEEWSFNCNQNIFPSLLTLSIQNCKALISLPHEFYKLRFLKHLEISNCRRLRSLPKMGIQGQKSSLACLVISRCPELTSQIDEFRYLTSLRSLSIARCSRLGILKKDLIELFALWHQSNPFYQYHIDIKLCPCMLELDGNALVSSTPFVR